jgi:hypothetical protein
MTEIKISKRYYAELTSMMDWCRENIGPGGYIQDHTPLWDIRTAFGNSTFSFVNERDATLFALRWAT